MELKDLVTTTITLTEKDICVLINEFLEKEGLTPDEPVTKLKVGTRYCGFGSGEHEEAYLQNTVIACKPTKHPEL